MSPPGRVEVARELQAAQARADDQHVRDGKFKLQAVKLQGNLKE